MKIGILKNTQNPLVSVTPVTVKKWIAADFQILIENEAGISSYISDDQFLEAGAEVRTKEEVLTKSDILFLCHEPLDSELGLINKNTLVIGLLDPFTNAAFIEKLRDFELMPFAMELLPRTSIAQSMDVLSSMASLAGYKSVISAAERLPGYFPMLTTAAGTVPPAKVLVLGAGVAGLQAIATAKRLGAQVEVFDVRKAVKEEVESLGGKFIEVAGGKDDMDAGGYAVEQSEEYLELQKELIHQKAGKADIIITTANIPGKKSPILVEKRSIESMQPGSVIIDMAAANGGNCEGTVNNQEVISNGVTILGDSGLAYKLPKEASKLYSSNLFNFTKHLLKNGIDQIDFTDKIVSQTFLGKVEHVSSAEVVDS